MLKRKDKLVGFLLAEAVHHELIELSHCRANFGNELLTLFGEVDVVKTSIDGMWRAEYESGVGELIDDADHRGFVDAEVFDQILLCYLPGFVVEVQHERKIFPCDGVRNEFSDLCVVLLKYHRDTATKR